MIDTKHRLRPERVHKYKANVFRDIKFLLVSVWKELCSKRDKERKRGPDENTPLINNH